MSPSSSNASRRVSRCRASSPGRMRLAASRTTLRCSDRSSSSSRRPVAASATTLLCSGSKASTTSWRSATRERGGDLLDAVPPGVRAGVVGVRAPHVLGVARAGAERDHAGAESGRGGDQRREPDRLRPSRTAASGWAMLYVPDTAAMVRPRAATAARTPRPPPLDLGRQRRAADERHVELDRVDPVRGDGVERLAQRAARGTSSRRSRSHHAVAKAGSTATVAPVSTERSIASITRIAASPSSTLAPSCGASGEDAVGEPLDLPAPDVRVLAERPVVLPVAWPRSTRPRSPGGTRGGSSWRRRCRARRRSGSPRASPSDGHRQVEVAERAVGELDADEPAVRADALDQLGAARVTISAAEEARRVDQVAAVAEHVVAPPVALGVAGRLAGVRAGPGDRLQVVGHRVAVGRVAVPRLQRDQLADLLADEVARERDAGIEAPHRSRPAAPARSPAPRPAAARTRRSTAPAASRPARACRPSIACRAAATWNWSAIAITTASSSGSASIAA